MMNCLDDEAVVTREVEKGSGFAWTAQFGQDVLGCKR